MSDPGSVERFYGRWAALYDLLSTRTPGIRAVRERTIDALALSPGDTVVEMGCGTGANFPFLRERVGASGQVVGVDLTPGVLARAQKRIERAGWENVHAIRGDATEPPLARVDAVLGTFVVGMFADPAGAVNRWADIVPTDGRIALLDAGPRVDRAGPLDTAFRAFVALSAPPTWQVHYDESPARTLGERVALARRALAGRGPLLVDERFGRGFLRLTAVETRALAGASGRTDPDTAKPRGPVARRMSKTVELVKRSLAAETRETFDRRVQQGAAFVREQLRAGELDNADPTIGLELECYVVDEQCRLATLPEDCLADTPVNRELGRHNVEINTPPAVLSDAGIEHQAETVREHLASGREVLADLDRRIVLDAMWTIPPEEGTRAYLSAAEVRDGVVIASNMHESARYHALDNDVLRHAGGEIELELPGVRETFPTILLESLATSIQPHLQVPDVASFPTYYNAAIRTLGPVLALTSNSPFLPADLYADADPETVLETTHHELRVPVFEQSINAGQERGKVRFPGDIDSPEDVADRIVEDGTLVPFLREWVLGEETDGDDADAEYTDAFWELSHKHGTYWRWLRGVVGGDYVDERNDERSLRIEYRPLAAQPSVTDLVGVQCLVSGLIQGLVATDHPLTDLPWDDARDSFYAAVEDGLDAELRWVTADGEHTTDASVIYDELFSLARAGLADAGVSEDVRERYLRPIERRWETRTTPSGWKLARVEAEVEDGATLAEAIEAMQREYVERSATDEPFVDWL